jgi:uncharacterized protein YjlB
MSEAASLIAPETYLFSDDGSIPNNPRLPLLVYRTGIDLKGSPDPQELVQQTFLRNKWVDLWRGGIYPYAQYHSSIHETMAIARGRAKVRFGGSTGQDIDLTAGDVVVLPAGTGHQGLWGSPELVIIGAYPPSGRYDLCLGSKGEYAKAIVSIPQVPLPETDPVFGAHGALQQLWRTDAVAPSFMSSRPQQALDL